MRELEEGEHFSAAGLGAPAVGTNVYAEAEAGLDLMRVFLRLRHEERSTLVALAYRLLRERKGGELPPTKGS